MIQIRPETAQDHAAIRDLIVEAFRGEGHDEADLVDAARRRPDFVAELSLVALIGERVIGHILFSPATIEGDGGATPILALAPLAVRAGYHRRGIGSRLVRLGLKACRELGHQVVTVAGSPRLYGGCGFVLASNQGLRDGLNAPEAHFQVIELVPGALDAISGVVRYPPAWDVFRLPE